MDEADTALEIRSPTEADLEDMLDVLTQAFDGWPGLGPDVDPREYLDWKCHSSPNAMAAHTLLLQKGEIIGSMLRIPRKVRVGHEILTAQNGPDASLIPRLQGRGLFSLMRQRVVDRDVQRGVAFQMSFGSHPAVAATWKRIGIVHPGNEIRVLLRPLRTIEATRRAGIGASLPRPLVAAAIWFMAMASRLRHGRSKVPADEGTMASIEAFDESVDALFESASRDFEFILVRDHNYLNWRFCDRRGGDFTVRTAREDGGLVGYCVLKFRDGRAFIADLLTRSGRLDVVERLVWDAVRLAREHGADGVTCQLPTGHAYTKTFLRAGFLDTRRRADFWVAPLSIDRRKLDFLRKRETRIHMMQGDSDLI